MTNSARHGTLSGYQTDRCRCDDCREAHTAYKRRYRRGEDTLPDRSLRSQRTNQADVPRLEFPGVGTYWWFWGHDVWPGGTPDGWRVAHLHAQLVDSAWIVSPEGRGKPLTVLVKDSAHLAQRRSA